MLNRYDGPTITLVVNPSAGRGRARKSLPKVCAALLSAMPEVHLRVHQATSFEDARLRTIQAVAAARPGITEATSPDTLVVMGGDGMAHLGVNACATTEVALGVIPAGTGNDFCRSAGLPVSLPAAVQTIVARQIESVDLNEVTGRLKDGAERRWVGCTVATGYDAIVSQAVSASKLKFGSANYAIVALRELARFEPLQYELTIDGQTRRDRAMFVAVSNGSTYGGGMKVAPRASMHDGELDLSIIHPVSKFTLLRLLPKIYDGSFAKDPAVELIRAREVTIRTTPVMIGDGDGELLGPTPLAVRSVAGALRLLVPRKVGS